MKQRYLSLLFLGLFFPNNFTVASPLELTQKAQKELSVSEDMVKLAKPLSQSEGVIQISKIGIQKKKQSLLKFNLGSMNWASPHSKIKQSSLLRLDAEVLLEDFKTRNSIGLGAYFSYVKKREFQNLASATTQESVEMLGLNYALYGITSLNIINKTHLFLKLGLSGQSYALSSSIASLNDSAFMYGFMGEIGINQQINSIFGLGFSGGTSIPLTSKRSEGFSGEYFNLFATGAVF